MSEMTEPDNTEPPRTEVPRTEFPRTEFPRTGPEPTGSSAAAFVAAPPADAREAARGAPPLLTALGLLILLVGLIWLWRQDVGLHQQLKAAQDQAAAAPAVDPARVAVLETTLETLRQQVAALQARPQSAPADLAPLQRRLSSLEQRPLPPPPPDLKPLTARVAALDARPLPPPAPDLKPLVARIATLEARPLPPPPPDLKPLESRIAALEQRKLAPDLGPLQARVSALEQKKPEDPAMNARVATLAAAQQATQQQAEAAAAAARTNVDRAARLQKVQQAQVSLQAGQPLGSLANAPASLSQFASTPPPTEAALRLAFPQAARQAAAASEPSTEGLGLAARMWQRAQALVTIRQGDRVVVGAPASATLAAARLRLDAGDLAGAVAALDRLDPKAAQVMAPWRARAQSLLDARAALATLAAG